MEVVDEDPSDFIAAIDDDEARDAMEVLDRAITTVMPGRRRSLWRGVFWGGSEQAIVGYGRLVQPRPRGEPVEWFVVGLARQRHGFSVYVNAVRDGTYLLGSYSDRLGKAKVGSASVAFRRLADIDLAALTELVAEAHVICPPDDAT